MSTLFFWDIDHGKLARLPFLKSLILICVGLLCAFLPIFYLSPPSIDSSKLNSVGSIRAVGLRSWALLFYASLVAPPLIFSFFNLMAKRIRDIGFYGWWFQFAIILLFVILANIHILLAVSMIPIYILFVFLTPPNFSKIIS